MLFCSFADGQERLKQMQVNPQGETNDSGKSHCRWTEESGRGENKKRPRTSRTRESNLADFHSLKCLHYLISPPHFGHGSLSLSWRNEHGKNAQRLMTPPFTVRGSVSASDGKKRNDGGEKSANRRAASWIRWNEFQGGPEEVSLLSLAAGKPGLR